MSKIKITEEMHVEKEWFEQAREQTLETLPDFINHVMNDYIHDYGTVCHAISACAIAAAWAADNTENGGITGFQASFVMWNFVKQWSYSSNKCGLKIIDYDDMLHPQYEHKFTQKTISSDIWESLQERAKELLEENKNGIAHPDVREHWKSIVNGVVPFGYVVKGE